MEKLVRQRTLKGEFAAKGSSGSRARRYNRQYARRVGKNASGPVNLFLTGEMLNNMRGAMTFRRDQGTARRPADSMEVWIRFLTGSAKKKFAYHQKKGSGRSRIKRRFVYLTASDRRRILRRGMQALTGNR